MSEEDVIRTYEITAQCVEMAGSEEEAKELAESTLSEMAQKGNVTVRDISVGGGCSPDDDIVLNEILLWFLRGRERDMTETTTHKRLRRMFNHRLDGMRKQMAEDLDISEDELKRLFTCVKRRQLENSHE
jgi:hypothetical protein